MRRRCAGAPETRSGGPPNPSSDRRSRAYPSRPIDGDPSRPVGSWGDPRAPGSHRPGALRFRGPRARGDGVRTGGSHRAGSRGCRTRIDGRKIRAREVRGRPIDGPSNRIRRRLANHAPRPHPTGTIRTERGPANERGHAADDGGSSARRHEPRHDPLCGEHQLGHPRGPLRGVRVYQPVTPARPQETRALGRGSRAVRRADWLTSAMLRSGRRARSAQWSRGAALPDPRRDHDPPDGPARRATGALLDLRHPRPVGRHPPRGRGRGLHRAHPHPGPGDPVRPCRSRRPRRRPDRDRQDRRVHPARSSSGSRTRRTRASRPPATRSGRS